MLAARPVAVNFEERSVFNHVDVPTMVAKKCETRWSKVQIAAVGQSHAVRV
jgi:hypothetical protein